MLLTDVAIRQAKPGPKATKVSDERGMFLLITPAGGKLWRFKYRFEGKEKLLALGAYLAVSLSEARKRREDARALLGKGKYPPREKQRDKIRKRMEAADTVKAIAAEYCAKRRRDRTGARPWRKRQSKGDLPPRRALERARRYGAVVERLSGPAAQWR